MKIMQVTILVQVIDLVEYCEVHWLKQHLVDVILITKFTLLN